MSIISFQKAFPTKPGRILSTIYSEPSIQEADWGKKIKNSRPALATKWVWGQPELHSEIAWKEQKKEQIVCVCVCARRE
jgi:hypothetical protein